MLHMLREKGDWFAPKRFGYGSGMPIAWQGWALWAGYLAVLGGLGLLAASGSATASIVAFALFVVLTGATLFATARHTRGGWKWRWGDEG